MSELIDNIRMVAKTAKKKQEPSKQAAPTVEDLEVVPEDGRVPQDSVLAPQKTPSHKNPNVPEKMKEYIYEFFCIQVF